MEQTYHRDSITDMLKELYWPSLQERQKQSLLILIYKIVNHNHLLIVHHHSLLAINYAHHPQTILYIQSTVGTYQYSFLPRAIPQCNNLNILNLPDTDLTTFKNLINLIK